PVRRAAPARAVDEQLVVLADDLDAQKASLRALETAAQQVPPLAEADLDLPFAATRHQAVERQRHRQAIETVVGRGGRDLDRPDHSRSARREEASSATSRFTSCERAFGSTRTASPVRTTTRFSTPSTAIVPSSANSRLPRASSASVSPRRALPSASP